jgi:allantoate deiminase
MDLRRDALTAAAEWILAVEATARAEDRLVATVGEVAVEPGAGNVVPGQVTLSLDVRHPRDEVRADAATRLHESADAIARGRGMRAWWSLVQETPAVACSPALADTLAEAIADTGRPVGRLPSGAGHDAAVMAAVGPVAMLFVRCAGGVSHHPAEAVEPADVAVAIEVLTGFVERLARAR